MPTALPCVVVIHTETASLPARLDKWALQTELRQSRSARRCRRWQRPVARRPKVQPAALRSRPVIRRLLPRRRARTSAPVVAEGPRSTQSRPSVFSEAARRSDRPLRVGRPRSRRSWPPGPGHERSVDLSSKFRPRRGAEGQLFDDEPEGRFGSTRPTAAAHGARLPGRPNVPTHCGHRCMPGSGSAARTAMRFSRAGSAGALRWRSGSQHGQNPVMGEAVALAVGEGARLKP